MTGRESDIAMRAAFGEGRMSPQRHAIVEEVLAFDGAFSAGELVECARGRLPSLATATIYRAIAAMAQAGFIDRVGESEGAVLWARCDTDLHHHHAICERCGALVCLECPLPTVKPDASAAHFRISSHEFRLYGLCAQCATMSGDDR